MANNKENWQSEKDPLLQDNIEFKGKAHRKNLTFKVYFCKLTYIIYYNSLDNST